MTSGKPYLRKKKDKWIIERKIEGKTKYIMTLPSLNEIINWKRPPKRHDKASFDTEGCKEKSDEEFAQSSLNVPNEEEIERTLEEIKE